MHAGWFWGRHRSIFFKVASPHSSAFLEKSVLCQFEIRVQPKDLLPFLDKTFSYIRNSGRRWLVVFSYTSEVSSLKLLGCLCLDE